MTFDAEKFWDENRVTNYDILHEGLYTLEKEEFMKYALIMEMKLIEAYKLGYADRNAKMTPFGDQDPKEYILYHLKNM